VNNELWLAGSTSGGGGGGGPTPPPSGYNIERSVRFNSADSAYLSRTPASAGNRKTWTWAGWVKRSKSSGTYQGIFTASTPSPNNQSTLYFDGDYITLFQVTNASLLSNIRTATVYRDYSAWYHIVLAVDTTAATSTDRVKLYVNGIQVTQFSSATYPAQNYDTHVNNNIPHSIGLNSAFPAYKLDSYLADIHLIDGQALDPTSFGEFDSNGVWQPKAYTGSYGTNGFHLPFSDNSTAAALGTDTSGNGNTWTVNNISVAAGAGNDSLVDSPTNYGTDTGVGGEVRGNYCTLNPLVRQGTPTLSNGNLEFNTNGSSGGNRAVAGTIQVTSGKWYAEFTVQNISGYPGVVKGLSSSSNPYSGTTEGYQYYGGDGNVYNQAASAVKTYSTYASGDIISVALDLDNGKVFFAKNGVWQGSSNPVTGSNPAASSLTGTWAFHVTDNNGGTASPAVTANFGQRPFAHQAPSGFKALCTANLPTPTIADGSTAMDVVTYTGTASALSLSTPNMSPDLVWIKRRNNAWYHRLYDSVRGAGTSTALYSNAADAEGSLNSEDLDSFDSTGFTVGPASPANGINATGEPFVAWTWDAGSSTVTNTDGSITSQVRANPSAGFSIVSYTQPSGAQTVGHGLGVAPVLIITKARNVANDWFTYSLELPTTHYLVLHSTGAAVNYGVAIWNNTRPTSTVFSVGAALDGNNYIAYCFAPVEGYSAFGSYTGNGSADGPFVYTGFRPKWILFKQSSASGNSWYIYDSVRGAYNVVTQRLMPDASVAELTNFNTLDMLSNGWKVRDANSAWNASGATYIYAAFAEHPFQSARAR
jgi:hypothetical protein